MIKANRKDGRNRPVLTCKTYKTNDYGHSARITIDGTEVGKFYYRPSRPLSCGAEVWFETDAQVEILLLDEKTAR